MWNKLFPAPLFFALVGFQPALGADKPPAPTAPDEAAAEEADEVAAEEGEQAGPPPDAPAEAPPEEGIWSWVERLDGEILSAEQLAALDEMTEEASLEQGVINGFASDEPPVEEVAEAEEEVPADPLFLDKVDPADFDIPIVINDDVRKWVAYFTGERGRVYFARWLGRSTTYQPLMHRELEKAGLPKDLVYLSMIESGYNAHAYSHASAAGLWQFIPSTARLYKMRVDWWADDRRDPVVSTAAGIAYLSELHRMFGDWHLAWASYNGGPGRVRRAMGRSGSKDFWTIAEGPYLHSETDNYVPKIIAAAIVGKYSERYGFTDIKYQPELKVERTKVDGSVEVDVLAKCAGISGEAFRKLNPAIRRWATPPEGIVVNVPLGSKNTFEKALAKLPKQKRIDFVKHRVAKGETLSQIAARYEVPVSVVTKSNELKNANRIYIGMSLVIPVPGSVAAKESPALKLVAYRVRSGDTLSAIASKTGVRMDQIRSWNKLKSDTIYVGQSLVLKGPGTASTPVKTVNYTVKAGDTLGQIAVRYGTTITEIQRLNKVANASSIYAGQTLTVPAKTVDFVTHTVKSGESLGLIAKRNKCSVDDIKRWNSLKSTVIHPGQKLKIKK
jgi:membrane-bound lytic murein transglycosylase D